MTEAQEDLQQHQQTTHQSGYHVANAAMEEKLVEATRVLQQVVAQTSQGQSTMANLTQQLVTMQQQLAAKEVEIEQLKKQLLAPRQPRKKFVKKDNGSYCWTHGYLVAKEHTSKMCSSKAPGHQEAATRENTMGGCLLGKPAL